MRTPGIKNLVQIALLVGLVFMAATNASAAKVYKWVDDEGNVHYGSNPPEDSNYKTLKTYKQKPSTSPANDEATPKGDDTSATQKPAPGNAPEMADRRKEIREEMKTRCETARHNLDVMETFRNITMEDPNGERRKIGQDEKEEKIKQAKEDIKRYCK